MRFLVFIFPTRRRSSYSILSESTAAAQRFPRFYPAKSHSLKENRTVFFMSLRFRLNRMVAVAWISSAALVVTVTIRAADDHKPGSQVPAYDPPISKASDEGLKAIRSFRVPAGLKVELFAAEPLLANPVAFCIDEKGVVYVAETFRLNEGVTDTRGHMDWLDDDLACRTVADRVAMYKKFLGSKFESYHVRARTREARRRSRRRRPRRCGDGFRRRLQRPGRRHRRRRAGAKGRRLVHLYPRALEAARYQGRRPGRPSANCFTTAMAFTSASWATTCTD